MEAIAILSASNGAGGSTVAGRVRTAAGAQRQVFVVHMAAQVDETLLELGAIDWAPIPPLFIFDGQEAVNQAAARQVLMDHLIVVSRAAGVGGPPNLPPPDDGLPNCPKHLLLRVAVPGDRDGYTIIPFQMVDGVFMPFAVDGEPLQPMFGVPEDVAVGEDVEVVVAEDMEVGEDVEVAVAEDVEVAEGKG